MTRYLTPEEIFQAEVGTTGDTRMVNGQLVEKVVTENGFGWIEWDSPERDGMFSPITKEDAIFIGLI